MRKAFVLLLALGGCAVQNHAPPFANLPYEPFSRSAAVAVATDEWRLWGGRVGLTPDYKQTEAGMGERQQGLWQRVGEYWWVGMNAGEPDASFTGKHDAQGHVFPITVDTRYAWSAAFISYVMRTAGAGRDFPYSPDHATYINYAARAAAGKVARPLLIAENPASYAPRLGDLTCFARGKGHLPTFADLPTAYDFPAHCGIVVAASPSNIDIISGNVDDAVTLEHITTDAQGLLTNEQRNWLVVLRVLYKEN